MDHDCGERWGRPSRSTCPRGSRALSLSSSPPAPPRAGTSDATNKFACGDLVQKGVGSEGSISISDGEDVLATSGYDITAETHHDMVTLSIDEPAADDLTISVERSGGSAVLVHGPGTSAVGTH